jgi:hypothetical protein
MVGKNGNYAKRCAASLDSAPHSDSVATSPIHPVLKPLVCRYCLVFFTYKMLLPRESLPRRNTVKPVNSSFLRCRCRSRLNVKGTLWQRRDNDLRHR